MKITVTARNIILLVAMFLTVVVYGWSNGVKYLRPGNVSTIAIRIIYSAVNSFEQEAVARNLLNNNLSIDQSSVEQEKNKDYPQPINKTQPSQHAAKKEQGLLHKIDRIVSSGRKCFEVKNFACAMAKSEAALEFMPKHQEALRLKKDTVEAEQKLKKMWLE